MYNEDDEVGFDVTDEIEVGDLSDQQGGVMEPCSRVPFSIRKASVITVDDKESKLWLTKKLKIEAQITSDGVDGEGKYKNKVMFAELLLAFNAQDFPEKFAKPWWKTEARFPTKQFLKAIGVDVTNVRVNDDFLLNLAGQEFMADIKKSAIQQKNSETGKWDNTGDYKNELGNYRSSGGSSSGGE